MTHSEMMFALVVGSISAIAVIVSQFFVSRSADKTARLAMKGIERQLELNAALKIAEFRQAWINSLRDSMAELQSLGVSEESLETPKFYRLGTKIELLMNRDDDRYQKLDNCIVEFMRATTPRERWQCSAFFVSVSQEILKTEWDVLKRDLKKVTTPTP